MSERPAILLIGGAGFIGSALARRLVQEQCEIHVLSRTPPAQGEPAVHYHRGGQENATLVCELLQHCGTVIHLASTTTPGSSARHPAQEAEGNLLPTLHFLEALQFRPPRRIILVSSGGTLYGDPEALPAGENSPLRPRSYHGAGKAALEHFFNAFASNAGVPLTVLRPSNVYGPGQTLRSGFGIARHLLDSARTGKTVEIWGDGETTRDFLYIDDLLDAFVPLLDQPGAQGIFNVGAGVGTTINQLCRLVEKITQRDLTIAYRIQRGMDIRAIVLDSHKLSDAIQWRPHIALPEGLRRTWDWMQHH